MDAYASRLHFYRHLGPIWDALPDELRGVLWKPYQRAPWPGEVLHQRPDLSEPIMVAGFIDVVRLQDRRMIYVEHGAGQSYEGDPASADVGSYSGGAGLDAVELFLCPNQTVADRWAARYNARTRVIGCPALDRWDREVTGDGGCVAITFHWECPLVPETRSALPHYAAALPALARLVRERGRRLIGHAHPRAIGMAELYERAGIEWVPNLEDVYARAGLLLADNTSVLYEFAALGRTVIVLNAPWYRRDVNHGLRFWDQVPGPMVNDPKQMMEVVHDCLGGNNQDWWRAQRERGHEIALEVYGPQDGLAAKRGADAIAAYHCAHG